MFQRWVFFILMFKFSFKRKIDVNWILRVPAAFTLLAPDASKSFRCWDPMSRKVRTSRDAGPSNLNQPNNQQEIDVFNSFKDQISSIDDQMDLIHTADLPSNEFIPIYSQHLF